MFVLCHAGKPDVLVNEDEEYKRVNFDKFKKLSTVFQVCASQLPSTCALIMCVCVCVFWSTLAAEDVKDLRFCQPCWRNRCSGFVYCIGGWVVPRIVKNCSGFILRVSGSRTPFFLDCVITKDEGTVILWNVGNHSHSDMVSYLGAESPPTLLWEPQMLCFWAVA
jgi:hypothetical protein